MDIQEKNRTIWNERYSKKDINVLLRNIDSYDKFLDDATVTDTSWVGMYWGGFRYKLKDKKILELGCGDGMNACIMERLGATVFANDISDVSGELINEFKNRRALERISFLKGDFLNLDLKTNEFDYIVGKAFLHHLPEKVEREFLAKISRILKSDGEARFSEPAINSNIIDYIRWLLPVPGRPSRLQKNAFKAWKDSDTHPDRDHSSKHYRKIGEQFFDEVTIVPLGCIERFHRILFPKHHDLNRKFRRFAFRLERMLPYFFRYCFARSQVIIYRKPKAALH